MCLLIRCPILLIQIQITLMETLFKVSIMNNISNWRISPYLYASVKDLAPQNTSTTSYNEGICLSASLNHNFPSKKLWIVDSDASHHVYSNADRFVSIRPIQNATIILPNQICLPVHFCDDIKINTYLILQEFYCTQNSIIISYLSVILLLHSKVTITFLPNKFIIQDSITKRMIDRDDKSEDLHILNEDNFFMSLMEGFYNEVVH